jgi:hypothetical protein
MNLFGESVTEARKRLLEGVTQGEIVFCPCCDKRVTVYHRKLNAGMAWCLIWLVREWKRTNDWVSLKEDDVPDAVQAHREVHKLRFWKLIEAGSHYTMTERTQALWKPTIEGLNFVSDLNIRVPSHMDICNNRKVRATETTVNIVEALGDRFDYPELMGGL